MKIPPLADILAAAELLLKLLDTDYPDDTAEARAVFERVRTRGVQPMSDGEVKDIIAGAVGVQAEGRDVKP